MRFGGLDVLRRLVRERFQIGIVCALDSLSHLGGSRLRDRFRLFRHGRGLLVSAAQEREESALLFRLRGLRSCSFGSGGGRSDSFDRRFGLHVRRLDLDGRRFGLDSRRFGLDHRRFDLDGRRFDLDSRRFDLDGRRFDLDGRHLDLNGRLRLAVGFGDEGIERIGFGSLDVFKRLAHERFQIDVVRALGSLGRFGGSRLRDRFRLFRHGRGLFVSAAQEGEESALLFRLRGLRSCSSGSGGGRSDSFDRRFGLHVRRLDLDFGCFSLDGGRSSTLDLLCRMLRLGDGLVDHSLGRLRLGSGLSGFGFRFLHFNDVFIVYGNDRLHIVGDLIDNSLSILHFGDAVDLRNRRLGDDLVFRPAAFAFHQGADAADKQRAERQSQQNVQQRAMLGARHCERDIAVRLLKDDVAAVTRVGHAVPSAVAVGVDVVAAAFGHVHTNLHCAVSILGKRVILYAHIVLGDEIAVAGDLGPLDSGLGNDRLGGRIEHALEDHNRRSVVIQQIAGDRRGALGVFGADLHVERQVVVVKVRPFAVIALHDRALGDLALIDGGAIGKDDGLHHFPIGGEGCGEAAELGGNAVALHEVLIAERLGLALVADAVDTGGGLMHEEVVACLALAVKLAGDGADTVAVRIQVHERGAAGDVLAEARDAADVVLAGQLALCVAVTDAALGHAGDTADIAAQRALRGAVAFAAYDDAEIGFSADAAGIILAGDGSAVVRGVHEDALGEVFAGQRGLGEDGGVALGIEVIFDRHRTGDTADRHIAVGRAVVLAAVDLAGGDGVIVLFGDVLDDILRVRIERELEDIAEIEHDDVERIVHGAHVADDEVGVVRRLRGQTGQARGNGAQFIEHALHLGAVVAVHARDFKRIVAGEIASHLVEVTHAGTQMSGGLLQSVKCALKGLAHVVHAGLAVGILGKVIGIDDLRHRGDVTGDRAGRAGGIACAAQHRVPDGLICRERGGIILIAVLLGVALPGFGTLGLQIVVAGAVGVVCGLHQPAEVRHGGVEFIRGGGEIVRGGLEAVFIRLGHLIDGVEIIKAVGEIARGCLELDAALRELGDRGRDHLLGGVDAHQQLIDGVSRLIHIIHRALGDDAGMLGGSAGRGADGAERRAHIRGGGAGVTQQNVHLIMQGVEILLHLADGACAGIELDVGLHLADDAADVLAAERGAPVRAARDETALAAGNAADVVAHMLEADRAPVRAADDDAGGEADDAADVGGGVGRLALVLVLVREADLVQRFNRNILGVHVHARSIGAVGNGTEVLTDGAADIVVAGDEALRFAVIDHAGGFVRTGNAADVVLAADRPGEVAARDGAHVGADDGADLRERAGGVHRAADVEILHRAAGLDVAEQAHVRAVAGERQAADGVSLTVERAAEGRDRSEISLGEIDIVVQKDRLVTRVGVILAGDAQLFEIIRSADVDHRGV